MPMSIFSKLKKIPRPKISWTSALVVATVLVLGIEFLTGSAGCVEIKPGEVAVFYDNLGFSTPRKKIVREQGIKTYIPGLQTVVVLSSEPKVLVMGTNRSVKKGSSSRENRIDRVDSLTVRASDGSNLYFDGLEVHYQIRPDEPDKVIESSGRTTEGPRDAIVAHVREVLRDEFGKYSFLEIADPTSYDTTGAKQGLNDRLAPYGVYVTQIITPKPQFDERVEQAIEDRQNSEQEVEVQVEKRNKLTQEKALKIQSVEQSKNAEFQSISADLEARKKSAENKFLSTQREADKYFIERQAAGQAYRDEKVTRAKANEVAYRKDAEALVAKITSVGAQGPDVLNSVIAEKVMPQLKKVKGTPLIKPASSIDIRHLQAGGGAK